MALYVPHRLVSFAIFLGQPKACTISHLLLSPDRPTITFSKTRNLCYFLFYYADTTTTILQIMTRRQITLADLAKELGISTATVSRALKDYPDISDETKAKVIALAQKWNYRPNSMAAGLRKRESKIIGVIVPDIINHFFSSVIKGIMSVAYEADYRVMLMQSDESFEKERVDADALFSSRVDGVLVSVAHGSSSYDHLTQFYQSGIPLVFFDKIPDGIQECSKVMVDDFHGAFMIVEHLIKQGCRRIVHFRGPLQASTSRNRYEGYLAALAKYKVPLDEDLVIECEEISLDEGKVFCQKLIDEGISFDGVFAVADAVALGAILSIRKAGLRIPEEVAVAGFSDWKISAVLDPPLSSVAQPSQAMGTMAANLLLKEISAMKDGLDLSPETVVLRTELKIRESSNRLEKTVIAG